MTPGRSEVVRGVELRRDGDRLVVRNTWAFAALGTLVILAVGTGFCGCWGFFGLLPSLPGETAGGRWLRRGLGLIALPAALLSAYALLRAVITHRRPYTFDRSADQLLDGGRRVTALSDITAVVVGERPGEWTTYAVWLVPREGEPLRTLHERVDDFQQRADAEQLAARIADFLGVPVRAGK